MSTPDRPTSTDPFSAPPEGSGRRLAGPERTHQPVRGRSRVPRTTVVIAAVLLAGILVRVVDNIVVMGLSVALVAAVLLTLLVGASRIPVLRRLTSTHRN